MDFNNTSPTEFEQPAAPQVKRKGISKRAIIIIALAVIIPIAYNTFNSIRLASVEPSESFKEAVSACDKDNNIHHIKNTYNTIFDGESNEIGNDADNKLLCYNYLTDNQKVMYRNYLYAARNFDYFMIDKSLYYDSEKPTQSKQEKAAEQIKEDVSVVEQAVYYDFPEIYWVEMSNDIAYEYSDYLYSSLSYSFSKLNFGYSDDELEAFKQEKQGFENKLKEITTEIKEQAEGQDDWNKALTAYKWVCDNASYDYAVAEGEGMTSREILLRGSIYSAVVDNSCVCRGYAQLYKALLDELGVDCACIVGFANQSSIGTETDGEEQSDPVLDGTGSEGENPNHIWNIIKIGEEYYNVDVTGGDCDDKNIPYDMSFFCASDEELSQSHKRSKEFDLPECTDASNGFFRHENLYSTSLSGDDFDTAIAYAIDNDYNFAAVQYENSSLANQAVSKYMVNSSTVQKLLEKYDRRYDSRINFDDKNYYYSQTDDEKAVVYVILNYYE